jgi:hypothetical protein
MTRKPNRTRKQLEQTAYHEAGHAVIGRVLTLHCGGATIRPNYDEGEAGHAITADPYGCLHQWEKRGHVRGSRDAVYHARIMTYMAGAEAEMILLGSGGVGDTNDRYQIALMAEELHRDTNWDKLEPRLRAMTRMLVRRHLVRIERVAKVMLARTTVSAKALDKMVGRSVDDVRVNAPFLLAMHRQDQRIPTKLEKMKDLPVLAYTSAREKIAEKFHMSQELLSALNPKQKFETANETIMVANVEQNDAPKKATRRQKLLISAEDLQHLSTFVDLDAIASCARRSKASALAPARYRRREI